MKKFITSVILVIALFATVFALTSCNSNKSEKVKVVSTIYPIVDIVENIGKDKVDSTQLVKGNPHSYTLTTQDLKDVEKADILFYISDDLEHWLIDKLKDSKTKGLITNLTVDMELLEGSGHGHAPGEEHHHEGEATAVSSHEEHHEGEHHHHEHDPHVWTSPKKMQAMAKKVLSMLCAVDFKNADFYKHNCHEYIEKLEAIDLEYAKLSTLPNKEIHVLHGAFAYMCSDYGLEQHAINISDTEITAADQAALVDELVEEGVKSLYYLSESEKSFAQAVKKDVEKKGKTLNIYQLYAGTNRTQEQVKANKTYLDILNDNLTVLQKGQAA